MLSKRAAFRLHLSRRTTSKRPSPLLPRILWVEPLLRLTSLHLFAVLGSQPMRSSFAGCFKPYNWTAIRKGRRQVLLTSLVGRLFRYSLFLNFLRKCLLLLCNSLVRCCWIFIFCLIICGNDPLKVVLSVFLSFKAQFPRRQHL